MKCHAGILIISYIQVLVDLARLDLNFFAVVLVLDFKYVGYSGTVQNTRPVLRILNIFSVSCPFSLDTNSIDIPVKRTKKIIFSYSCLPTSSSN